MNNIQLKQTLTAQELMILQSEMEKRAKSTAVAYVLWFFLGTSAIHQFYLGRISSGLRRLLAASFGFAFVFMAVGTHSPGFIVGAGICLIAFSVYSIYDLFTMSRQTRSANEKIEHSVLIELMRSRGPAQATA